MPAEDRDRLFEQALAGQLRRESADSDSACADAETLAAYHERLLSAEEMAATKEHLVSCARCQQVLAHLEAPEVDEAGALVTEEMPLAPALALQSGANAAAPAAEASVMPLRGRRRARIVWAGPALAIAATLLLWVGIRNQRTHLETQSAPTQVAENGPQPYVAPDRESPVAKLKIPREETPGNDRGRSQSETPPMPRHDASKEPTYASPVLPKMNGGARSDAANEVRRDSAAGRGIGSGAGADTDAMATAHSSRLQAGRIQSKASPQSSSDAAADRSTSPGVSQALNDTLAEAKKSRAADPRPPPPPPAAPPSSPGANVAKTESYSAAQVATVEAVDKDQKQLSSLTSTVLGRASLPAASAADPTGKVVWRFGDAGTIIRSADGGKSFRSQLSGVSANLTSGSAPSKKVCWVAGASGTLLLTTDAGKHWKTVATPISGDLGGVEADDSDRATIWNATRALAYRTLDRGVTWTLAAN